MLTSRSGLVLEFAPLRRHLVFPFRKLELYVRSEFKRRQIISHMLRALQKRFGPESHVD